MLKTVKMAVLIVVACLAAHLVNLIATILVTLVALVQHINCQHNKNIFLLLSKSPAWREKECR